MEYTPSEIEWIMKQSAVRDFQFYKQMNNNEFLLEHESKVAERSNAVDQMQTDVDPRRDRQRELDGKGVLLESEMIEYMRRMTSDGGVATGGASGGSSMFFTGDDQGQTVDRRKLNVVWSTYDENIGGVDSIFGFDDDDDGLMW